MKNSYMEILNNQETAIAPKVEAIFSKLENESADPKYMKFTEEAKKEELNHVKNKTIKELQGIKREFERSTRRMIEDFQLENPKQAINNNYKLLSMQLFLASMTNKEKLEVLKNTLNKTDFHLIKGALIMLNNSDGNFRKEIENVKYTDGQDLKNIALGTLSLKVNDYGYMPGTTIARQLHIRNVGITGYVEMLLGINQHNTYF